ncbi:hypothetical protein H5410_036288 [Solanum commersonii]|uniref:Uncharacterized protein n=1 Tax=Solanum commersonii TaxID=4109 RepID=A0A9J5Y621_SOLCO|nr:hypothetical protein H5410_036288 [Solanum commersonii]
MTHTRSMVSLKNVSTSPSSSFEINLLSSDSSEAESVGPSSLTKKRPYVAKKKVSKKSHFALPDSLTDEDSLRFWGLKHKRQFVFLQASHCTWKGGQSGAAGRISLRYVFGFDFSGDIPFMHGNLWPENFEISLENAKLFASETGANFTNFGPLSLGFENRILAHIVATTLIPWKGSLSNISNRDVYVVYCLLKKLRINWALWFHEYMADSLEDTNSSSSLPYGC